MHKSVQALEADIRGWIENWNASPRPFTWNKTADEILGSLAKIRSEDFRPGTLAHQKSGVKTHSKPDRSPCLESRIQYSPLRTMPPA
jgi:hypothetical protein